MVQPRSAQMSIEVSSLSEAGQNRSVGRREVARAVDIGDRKRGRSRRRQRSATVVNPLSQRTTHAPLSQTTPPCSGRSGARPAATTAVGDILVGVDTPIGAAGAAGVSLEP